MLRSHFLKIEIDRLKGYGSLESDLKGRGELNRDNYLVHLRKKLKFTFKRVRSLMPKCRFSFISMIRGKKLLKLSRFI